MNSQVQSPYIAIATPRVQSDTPTPKNLVERYIEAFNRNYPNKTVDVVKVKAGYKIYIDGEWSRDDVLLSIDDMFEAIDMFNKGRKEY